MITVKKNAIKYKDSDGRMQSAGVLCQVGALGVEEEFSKDWWLSGFNGLTNYANKFRQFKNETIPWIDTSQGTSFQDMFNGSNVKKIPPLDTSKGTMFSGMFQSSPISEIPELNLSEATSVQSMFYGCQWIEKMPSFNTKNVTRFDYFLYNARALKEIGILDFSSATNTANAFNACISLVKISFVEGSIKTTIAFSSCSLLSDTSIQSIIDGLADLTGGTAQTITFHKDIEAKLSEEQKAQITSKNWTLAFSK